MIQRQSFLVIALLFTLASFSSSRLHAQEFECKVSVISPQIQTTNEDGLTAMQTAIQDFFSTRRWTNLNLLPMERIKVNIVINIDQFSRTENTYSGTFQISAIRPVYGTSFTSNLINMIDQDFNITFVNGQLMNYTEGVYNDELTSLLAYYAYLILGYDGDSFAQLGGQDYFKKAQAIVNSASSSGKPGWGSGERNNRNRFFTMFEIMNDQYRGARIAYYLYYRKGLDQMAENNDQGIDGVKSAIGEMKKIRDFQPAAAVLRYFFESHYNEIIDLVSEADSEVRCQIKKLLMETDVPNSNKYSDRIPC